jgi:hypothetical protein
VWKPGAGRLAAGISAARDSQTQADPDPGPGEQAWENRLGADLRLDLGGLASLQGEWVATGYHNKQGGLLLRKEGWYAQQAFRPLQASQGRFSKLELLARYERVIADVHGIAAYPAFVAALAVGIKLPFGKKNHWLLEYSAFGPQNDFKAAEGTQRWVLQQQLVF